MGPLLTSNWDNADIVFDSCFNYGFHVLMAPWPDHQVRNAANFPCPQGKQLTAGVACKEDRATRLGTARQPSMLA